MTRTEYPTATLNTMNTGDLWHHAVDQYFYFEPTYYLHVVIAIIADRLDANPDFVMADIHLAAVAMSEED
jgi:hypothetical protein